MDVRKFVKAGYTIKSSTKVLEVREVNPFNFTDGDVDLFTEGRVIDRLDMAETKTYSIVAPDGLILADDLDTDEAINFIEEL